MEGDGELAFRLVKNEKSTAHDLFTASSNRTLYCHLNGRIRLLAVAAIQRGTFCHMLLRDVAAPSSKTTTSAKL